MTIELVGDILSDMFFTGFFILLPVLGASLVLGLIISIFQAVTSIQEMTLTFVPKIVITLFVLILMIPYIAEQLMDLAIRYFSMIETIAP